MAADVPDDVLWCPDLVTELAGCLEVIEGATIGTTTVDETSLNQVPGVMAPSFLLMVLGLTPLLN